jgi:hypothetical protein
LVFGGTGAIGMATVHAAMKRNWTVIPSSRKSSSVHGISCVKVDPFGSGFDIEPLAANGPYQAVCWAQGWNFSDNVFDVDLDRHLNLYKANCLFVLATLQVLAKQNLLVQAARLCVVSSIWQLVSRQDKLSYSMSKGALQGLVLSAATDLAADGHLFNAVLPGILDTPMTRTNLTADQMTKAESATKFRRLPTMEDVTSLILYLCSPENTGITGQFIAADLGMSRVHLL